MADITSTEFRVKYAQLRLPTVVTALGRPIGTWYPIGTEPIGTEAILLLRPKGRSDLRTAFRQIFGLPPR